MKVTQVTVFLENRSGRLAEIADLLGRRGVNIRGFSTTEAAEYGIVRLIVPDPVAAREILHEAGSVRAANVALLGAATHALPFGSGAWDLALEQTVPPKILELNRRAFALGRDAAAPTEEGL